MDGESSHTPCKACPPPRPAQPREHDQVMPTEEAKKSANATGWQTLLDFGKANDDRTLDDWKDELANLLTFTGLFSAVVTGFIVLAIPLLQEDTGEKSARLLEQISLQLSSFRVGAQFLNSTTALDSGISAPFEPDGQAVQINILWIASLTLTLMASFFTIAAQQWLRCIPLPPHLTIREAVRLRQFRQDGLLLWKVPTIISLLPVVVQISVVLFLAGLLLLLEAINSAVATVFAIIGGSLLGLFLITVFTPLLFASSPFKSPVIPALVALIQFIAIPVVTTVGLACWLVGSILSAIVVTTWNVGAMVVRSRRVVNKKPPRRKRTSRPGIAVRHNTMGDAFLLTCAHTATSILALCFSNTSQFWLRRELSATKDEAMDCDALSDAPMIVPKGQLWSLRACVDELRLDQRLYVAASWARHMLSLTSRTTLWLCSHLHATTYTGPLRHASPSTFLQLRETLWHTLPEEWASEEYHRVNRNISMMLCLLFRSIPEQVDAGDSFLQQLGSRLCSIRDSQSPEKAVYDLRNTGYLGFLNMYFFRRATPAIAAALKTSWTRYGPVDINAGIVPTTLLFHCCQRGFTLSRDQLMAALKWTAAFHTHLLSIIGKERVGPFSYRPNIMRMEELSVPAAAIVVQAVARDPSLLDDDDVREAANAVLHTSAEIIHKFRFSLQNYTAHISAMPPGTHILACVQAIEVIAQSVVELAKDGRVAQSLECPSRQIMADFREICDVNRMEVFAKTREYLDEYDDICGVMVFDDNVQTV